ncbi:hypothetical protein ACQPZX_00540 [Actinoplanes sp. CA-142083]|uniref:hypothetical protein n=1 Tax=Actinoplanes sp. CA-142083 TaxID=3239903 RepID=UPI003D92DC1A
MPDEDLVPPLKVMRKRLNGVYRADTGFSGPTRRYVLIVALLVGLASAPTLAAITAGSSELADGGTDTMDVPFLPPALPGPVHPDSRVGASPPLLPPGVAGTALRAGRLLGEAGKRRVSSYPYGGKHAARGGGSAKKSGSDKSSRPHRSSAAAFPALPGMPALPNLPSVPEGSARPARPASSALDPVDFAEGGDVINDLSDIPDSGDLSPQHHQRRCARSTDKDRSPDRSEHSRRSPVAERPQNIRASRILERSYPAGSLNTRHLIPEARTEENQIDRPYRGSHRAGSLHHADDTPAQRRSSRVGRHHAEPTEDVTGRW